MFELAMFSVSNTETFSGFEAPSLAVAEGFCQDLSQSWNRGRFLDSRRVFFTCFFCSQKNHDPAIKACDASPEARRSWAKEASQRDRERMSASCVLHKKKGPFGLEVQSLPNPAACKPSGFRRQSIGHVDAMPLVQDPLVYKLHGPGNPKLVEK